MVKVHLFLGTLLMSSLLFCPVVGNDRGWKKRAPGVEESEINSLENSLEDFPSLTQLGVALDCKDLEYLDAYGFQIKVEEELRRRGSLVRVPDLKSVARPQLEGQAVSIVLESGIYTNREKRDTLKYLFNLGVPFTQEQRHAYVAIKDSLSDEGVPYIMSIVGAFHKGRKSKEN